MNWDLSHKLYWNIRPNIHLVDDYDNGVEIDVRATKTGCCRVETNLLGMIMASRLTSSPQQPEFVMLKLIFLFLAANLLLFSATSQADIYYWRDANGVIQYSDTCPTGVNCKVVQGKGARSQGATSTSTTSGSTTSSPTTSTSTTSTSTTSSPT